MDVVKMLRSFLCCTFFLLFCSGCDRGVRQALELAGDNRSELEKALEHYPKNSLKYKAARFLVENMPLHHYPAGQPVEDYRDSVFSMGTKEYERLDTAWQRIRERGDAVRMVQDVRTVPADLLIRNIDQAFEAWETAPWHDRIDFDTFCNYILPYRVLNEPPAVWRDSLREKYAPLIAGVDDPKRAFAIVYRKVYKDFITRPVEYAYLPDVRTLNKMQHGICSMQCVYMVHVMRALGIPAAYDLVTYWANYSQGGHSWVSYPGEPGETYILYGEDTMPTRFRPIDSSTVLFDFPYDLNSCPICKVDTLKKSSKLFRRMYALRFPGDYGPEEGMPSFFRDYHTMDVSASYGRRESVTVQLSERVSENVYLCAFASIKDWQPVVCTAPRGRKAVFRDITGDIVYLPALFRDNRIVPLTQPFLLKPDGTTVSLEPDTVRRERVVLKRKYPLFALWVRRWHKSLGSRFEASDYPDFSDAKVLYEIEEIPFGMVTIEANAQRPYRYLRFVSPDEARPNIAELVFRSKTGDGRETVLSGREIGGDIPYGNIHKAFDGDYLTYSESKINGYWFGYDLGAGNRSAVSSFSFCLRNDTNMVMPGELYELFYYDMGWHSLGRQTAEADSLTYENVPKGALLWLRNHTQGREERIFTYENGRQVWW